MTTCPHCQFDAVPAAATVCPNCGKPIAGGGDAALRVTVTQNVGTVQGGKVVGTEINYYGDQEYDVRGLPNPFLGLQSFEYKDRAKYGGRKQDIETAVTKLTAPGAPQSLLFVTGASGSGKSSFAQAGLLPALEKHYAAFTVKHAVFRPSADPLAGLNDALWRQLTLGAFDVATVTPESLNQFLRDKTPPNQINLIVVDQFEELFTQSASQPRDTLFAWLTQLPPFMQTRTHIIAT
ncbi:MAG: hypothetical protein ABI874_01295, partial [Chloroflexota bacterium]